jgi:hypothetical protein
MSKTSSLKHFDLATIKKNRIILISGKRGSGKTTLLKSILYEMRNRFDVAVGFGGSRASIKMLEDHIPKCMVFGDPIIQKIEQLVQFAKALIQSGKRREFLLVLDDCTFRKDIFKYPIFREIFMNARHLGITVIIATGYIMDLEVDLRSQIDYVFTFKELIRVNQKRLWNYFFGMFESFSDFQTVLQANTKNYECLVMDNTDNTGELDKTIFYFKVPLNTPSFTLGKGIYYSLSDQYQINESDDKKSNDQKLDEIIVSQQNDDTLVDFCNPLSQFGCLDFGCSQFLVAITNYVNFF